MASTPQLMVTDPPYGVDYDPKWRAKAGVNKNRMKLGAVSNDDRADWREAWALFPGQRRLCLVRLDPQRCGDRLAGGLRLSSGARRSSGARTASRWGAATITGNMNRAGMPCGATRTGAAIASNPRSGISGPARIAAAATARRSRSNACGGRSRTTAAPARPSTSRSAGSGTTIIAAEMTGRACHAIELNPVYVDVAVRRWQAFTGKTAILEANGVQLRRDRGAARCCLRDGARMAQRGGSLSRSRRRSRRAIRARAH